MKTTILTMLGLISCAVPARAFTASITATSDGDGVTLTVTVVDPMPPAWGETVGYTVVRDAMGVCAASVPLTEEPVAFTEGLQVIDYPAYRELANSYSIRAIDTQGNLVGFEFGFHSSTIANPHGAPLIRGRVVSGGVFGHGIAPCSDSCWMPSWYWGPLVLGIGGGISLYEYFGTETVLDVYGDVGVNFEGPYLIVDHAVETTCDAVAVQSRSWGDVKSLYGHGAP